MSIRAQKQQRLGMLAAIVALAWPTMLEQLMQTAVQYIDTAMVGTLGTQATAAVGATSTVNWLVGSTISAIGVGFLAYIAQARGCNDHERASKASGQSVLTVLVLGVFFTAMALCLSRKIPVWMQVDSEIRVLASQYFFILYTPMLARTATIIFGTVLRSAGDSKTPMRVGVLVNIINVVLNFLMIYPTRRVSVLSVSFLIPGAGMGIIGAAIASAIAFFFGGIVISIVFWKNPVISPRGYSIKPDWSILRQCLKIALPNAIQRFGTSLGYVAFASMINSLGEISTAAHTIANTVESAFYIPGYGMQTAAATLAGNAFGAKDEKRIRELARVILLLEIILMIISGGLLYCFAPEMMGAFSNDYEVILLGSRVLKMVALSEPFYGVSIIIEGMLQGMGRTMFPFLCNIFGMWGIRIAGTFLCTQLMSMGLVSAWACMILHNLFLCVMFVFYFRSGKWNLFKQEKMNFPAKNT